MQILQQLDQCKGYPDFNNYLAFIFAQGDSLDIEVRTTWDPEAFVHSEYRPRNDLAETDLLLWWHVNG